MQFTNARNQLLYVLTPVLLLICGGQLSGQTDSLDQRYIPGEKTENAEQQANWRSGTADFSARPRDSWEVGLHTGNMMINGDVASRYFSGFGVGAHVRKALSYTFSLRMDIFYGQTKSWDISQTNPEVLTSELFYQQNLDNSRATIDEYIATNSPVVRNYKTSVFGASIQGLVNFGNLLFHQPENKWGMYGLLGVGFYAPNVKLNFRDENSNIYDYASAFTNLSTDDRADRKEIRKNIKDLLDDDFETSGAYESEGALFGDEKKIIPSFHAGLGVSRKINERLNVSLEHQVIFSNNDLLDGYEFRGQQDISGNSDVLHYTNIRLNINLGNQNKRTQPLYWLNPNAATMHDLGELKRRPIFDKTDSDGDGVIDVLDAELNSPENSPVDTRGVALDSDEDGMLDIYDEEKFSPPGYETDEKGVAQIPPGPEYMTEDDVNRIVDGKISAIPQREWWMPMIHFDLDRYFVKPEFYTELYQVANVMRANPDIRIRVVGHADVRNTEEYNQVLSYNRALATIDFLVENYDLDRQRFVLMYGGEMQPIVKDLSEKGSKSKDEEYKQGINRRVEFSIAKKNDASMERPEGPEAGIGPKRKMEPVEQKATAEQGTKSTSQSESNQSSGY